MLEGIGYYVAHQNCFNLWAAINWLLGNKYLLHGYS